MIRAAIGAGVFAGLILLLVLNVPAWAAITGSVVALVCVGVGGSTTWIYRHSMVVQWGKIPEAETCVRCKGWGVLDKNGDPFLQDPRTLAHVLWAHGNRRTCRTCNGRGYYSPRRAANKTPGPVTSLVPADDPDDLLFPDGPDQPQAIEPTAVIPPEWWKKGEKT